MKSKEELLKVFLEGHPDSNHFKGRQRFLEYAVACANEGQVTIDTEEIRKSGKVSEKMICMYDKAYPWIRDTFQYTIKVVFEDPTVQLMFSSKNTGA